MFALVIVDGPEYLDNAVPGGTPVVSSRGNPGRSLALRGFVPCRDLGAVAPAVPVGVPETRVRLVPLYFVTVLDAVAVGVSFSWVGVVALYFGAVVQAVAVGVSLAGTGVEPAGLGGVAQAVPVRVAAGGCSSGRRLLALGRRGRACGRGRGAGNHDHGQLQATQPTPHRHIVVAGRARPPSVVISFGGGLRLPRFR